MLPVNEIDNSRPNFLGHPSRILLQYFMMVIVRSCQMLPAMRYIKLLEIPSPFSSSKKIPVNPIKKLFMDDD
jgi:hypothetical protein